MRAIFRKDRVALVQQALTGRDYRLVVLDGKVISAYERVPLSVTGDGRAPVLALLARKQRAFERGGRDTRIKVDDPRIREKLARQGLDLQSVLERGRQVFLLDNANLSAGGDALDVTAEVHPEFRRLAVRLTKDMGLRMCGVDLMIAGGIEQRPQRYWILEVNAAPGLDHYAASGKAQQAIVEALYLKVLRQMSH
jgi:D-alanine-D-alanine ligase-like ATP-grasp enzyme